MKPDKKDKPHFVLEVQDSCAPSKEDEKPHFVLEVQDSTVSSKTSILPKKEN